MQQVPSSPCVHVLAGYNPLEAPAAVQSLLGWGSLCSEVQASGNICCLEQQCSCGQQC